MFVVNVKCQLINRKRTRCTICLMVGSNRSRFHARRKPLSGGKRNLTVTKAPVTKEYSSAFAQFLQYRVKKHLKKIENKTIQTHL